MHHNSHGHADRLVTAMTSTTATLTTCVECGNVDLDGLEMHLSGGGPGRPFVRGGRHGAQINCSICASICGTSSRPGPSAPKGGIEGPRAALLILLVLIPKIEDEGELSGCAIEDDGRGLEANEMRMGGARERIGAREGRVMSLYAIMSAIKEAVGEATCGRRRAIKGHVS